MSEYNKIAEGSFTSSGAAEFISMPFLPNSFEMWNVTAYGTPTQNEIAEAISWQSATAATASVKYFNATPVLTTTNLASGGISFITADTYMYGPTIALAATFVTQAAAAVVTTASAHGLSTGDAVLIYGTASMLQIAGEIYTVTVLSTTTFSIPVNSSGFASAATAGFMKQVLYPDLYVPYRAGITNVTQASSAVITTAVNHGFVVGQEVFFQFPTVSTTSWGMFEMDTLTYNAENVIPQQAYVTAVTANTLTVNINSTGYTAFAYPTSAQASLGINFPAVYAIGDQNYGPTGPPPFTAPIVVPGAFYANTRQGVLVGLGNGTQLLHQTNDVVRWRATYPDLILT
jgi:hypothetical protein